MSKDLDKLDKELEVVDLKWTPKQYSQFLNCELKSLFTKDPNIDFQYGEAALRLFAQGMRPSQFNCIAKWRGQGYVYFVSFFKSKSTGKLIGVIEFIPANNKDDNLSGKTASGQEFEYQGKKIGVRTDQVLTGSTGGVHRAGQKNLIILNPELYSHEDKTEGKTFNRDIPQLAGGAFVGETAVLGEFRVNSGTINQDAFNVNPLFLLLHCHNSITEGIGSEFWYRRIMPEPISDLLLKFLLETLPLKEGQKRIVSCDYRKSGETSAEISKEIRQFLSLTEIDLKRKLENRLLFFSSSVYEEKNYEERHDFYNVSKIILESKKQGLDLDVNVVDEKGRTPLSYILEKLNTLDEKDQTTISSNIYIIDRLIDDVKTLLDFGADPLIKDKTGKIAFDYDKKSHIFILLNKMYNEARLQNDKKLMARWRALRADYIYRKLQTEGYQWVEGAYVKCLSDDKRYQQSFPSQQFEQSLQYGTLLHALVQHSPDLVYDTLFFLRVDLTVKDSKGMTAFDYFLTKTTRHKDDNIILELFLQDRADFSLPWQVPGKLQPLLISQLIQEAKQGNFKPFLLVQKGFEVNIPCKITRLRLLEVAIIQGKLEIVKLLLDLRANPNMKNDAGNNALQLLMLSNQVEAITTIEIAKLLLAAGCSPFSRNLKGQSAYDLCPGFLKPLLDKHISREEPQNYSSNRYLICASQSKSNPRPLEDERPTQLNFT